ncbi:MAG: potassium/proton antiporter [Erysipelotrichaceae bacterium]|nr:potassium/proton antiporter [Erysipelotrichaceae bacterium]
MNEALLLVGIVIAICLFINRITEKLPIPTLLLFLILGMLFGENGIFQIPFDNYFVTEVICSTCLIFIMYYGGFGVNLKVAKKVLPQSVLLSTIGVVLTAFIVGLFVHFAFGLSLLEGMLIGSVIGSTDAATVFHILKTKNLNLKYQTDSLLEVESGSNDPISYLLTVVLTALFIGQNVQIPVLLLSQVVFGVLSGLVIGQVTVLLLKRMQVELAQAETMLVIAMVMIAYALPAMIGGNGYISVYLCGIVMGNSDIPEKRSQVHFFDTLTGIAQMMIFFLLGLLVTPMKLNSVVIPSFIIMLFLTLIARPVAVSLLLLPFHAPKNQIALVSWSGLRGVASIVFAIYVVVRQVPMTFDLFNLVFCMVFYSICFQGTLIPWMAKRLDMIDEHANVQRTFNDYQECSDISFIKIHLDEDHPWIHKTLKEVPLSKDLLVGLILRKEDQIIVPSGDTELEKGDLLVLAGQEFDDRRNLMLQEVVIGEHHKWNQRSLSDIDMEKGMLIIMLRRGKETIVPSGSTVLHTDDTIVIAKF